MEPKDYIGIVGFVLSLVAFILSIRRERRASQDSIIKALQGEKEAVMYVAYKATSAKWRGRLKKEKFREDVVTAMGLAWIADSSDRPRALIFAALRGISADHKKSVQMLLDTLITEFAAYQTKFVPSDFQHRIVSIKKLYNALGFEPQFNLA